MTWLECILIAVAISATAFVTRMEAQGAMINDCKQINAHRIGSTVITCTVRATTGAD